MVFKKLLQRGSAFKKLILFCSLISVTSSADLHSLEQKVANENIEILNEQACQCKFKSKHYTWDNTKIPVEQQQPLYQIKHEYVITNWTFYQSSSRFRCVYECIDNDGNMDLVEYTHSESQPGYYDGGLTAAKLFNCSGAVSAFTRRGSYYQTHEAIGFSPMNSNIDSIKNWAIDRNCRY